VAPGTGAILYVFRSPEQTESGPVIVPGLDRAESTDAFIELGELGPQPLTARTVMMPELVPEVTLIVLVVLLPVHPDGSVHA
jgi:hypothetical protein